MTTNEIFIIWTLVLATAIVLVLAGYLIAIAWYRGLGDGALVRYLGASALGAILFIVMVMTARDAKPRRMAVLLVIVLILLLLSRCGGANTARNSGPEPTLPWAGDPLPPATPAPKPASSSGSAS